MNEERQNFKRYIEGKSKAEVSFENLLAMTSSLESRAKLLGAFSIVQELNNLRKAAAKTGANNKKLIKSLQKKYMSCLEFVQELEKTRKKHRK